MIPFYQVDAFTSIAYKGNPAGVVILDEEPGKSWMMNVANEINLSETAFLWPENVHYHLKWFTPEIEVDLCGHATLAASAILYNQKIVSSDQEIIYNTRSGFLNITKTENWIGMKFPSRIADINIPVNELHLQIFGEKIKKIVVNQYGYMVVELNNSQDVIDFVPDFNQLLKLGKYLIIITGRSNERDYDFKSRVFAPAFGIHEDAVTGSAHCVLAPYWSAKLNKQSLTGYQASKRGGEIKMELNKEEDKILLKGQAVKVLEGYLLF